MTAGEHRRPRERTDRAERAAGWIVVVGGTVIVLQAFALFLVYVVR